MVMHTFAEFLNMMTIEKAHLTKHRPTPAEFQPMLDDLPPDVAAHVIYVQEDISKWTYNTFKNLMHKHLDLAVNQLASVHSSLPCTTWSRVHHSKNPHRQRGKGRNLLPRTKLARHHDKILGAACVMSCATSATSRSTQC